MSLDYQTRATTYIQKELLCMSALLNEATAKNIELEER
jgi:hypothetical protein